MSALIWPGVLWLGLAAILVTLIVSLGRLDKTQPKASGVSHRDEWHHGWLVLVSFGVLTAFTFNVWISAACGVAFALIAADDAWQHYVQAYRDKDYKSPGWRFYRWLVEILK